MASDNNKSYVSVGKPKITGAVYRAALGTTLPTTADETLAAAFVCMGYVSDEGIKRNTAKEHSEIKAWGGDIVAVPQTGHSDKFSASFIEALNGEVQKAVNGDSNVSGTLAAGLAVTVNGHANDGGHIYVIDQELTGNVKMRTVIPDGKVTEVGEVTYKDDTVIAYPLTITALPDADENTHYEYFKTVT